MIGGARSYAAAGHGVFALHHERLRLDGAIEVSIVVSETERLGQRRHQVGVVIVKAIAAASTGAIAVVPVGRAQLIGVLPHRRRIRGRRDLGQRIEHAEPRGRRPHENALQHLRAAQPRCLYECIAMICSLGSCRSVKRRSGQGRKYSEGPARNPFAPDGIVVAHTVSRSFML